MRVCSVNVGQPRPSAHSDVGVTGIDKRPADGPVAVSAPGPRGVGGSGVAGDHIGDLKHHGGNDQAVYSYAREDLDYWAEELGRPLADGAFGENLTTEGINLSAAIIGERWRVGADLLLEVSLPRIPCRTFAGWLGIQGWVRRFTEQRAPGAYLRVLAPGVIRADDPVVVTSRPAHGVTIERVFRALTDEPNLLPDLLVADRLPASVLDTVRRRVAGVTPRSGA